MRARMPSTSRRAGSHAHANESRASIHARPAHASRSPVATTSGSDGRDEQPDARRTRRRTDRCRTRRRRRSSIGAPRQQPERRRVGADERDQPGQQQDRGAERRQRRRPPPRARHDARATDERPRRAPNRLRRTARAAAPAASCAADEQQQTRPSGSRAPSSSVDRRAPARRVHERAHARTARARSRRAVRAVPPAIAFRAIGLIAYATIAATAGAAVRANGRIEPVRAERAERQRAGDDERAAEVAVAEQRGRQQGHQAEHRRRGGVGAHHRVAPRPRNVDQSAAGAGPVLERCRPARRGRRPTRRDPNASSTTRHDRGDDRERASACSRLGNGGTRPVRHVGQPVAGVQAMT